MESGEILTSLAKLEASLKEIESAKEQVQQTVNAYAFVQKQIEEYTKTLDSTAGSIKSIINDVQSQSASLYEDAATLDAFLNAKAEAIVSLQNTSVAAILDSLKTSLDATKNSFSKNCSESIDMFKKNTEDEFKKLDVNVEALKNCATNLNSLHENIKNTLQTINEVKQEICTMKQTMIDSQGVQDTQLTAIKSDIATLSAQQSRAMNILSEDLTRSQGIQYNAISDLSAAVSALSVKLDTIEKRLAKSHSTIIALVILNILAVIVAAIIRILI